MRGERERQAELGGELRAVKARSRIQIGTCEPAPGTAFTRCPGAGSRRKAMSSCTSCGKESTFGARLSASAVTWSPRRASKPEIDAAREERLECAKLLGNQSGRVIREHDPASADADRRCACGDVSDDDRRRRARPPACCGARRANSGDSPTALHAGQVEAVPERLGGGAAFDDRGEIEDGKGVMSNSVRRAEVVPPMGVRSCISTLRTAEQ